MSKSLMIKENLSLTEISEKLNYSSVYSFSKAFKNKYGLSPSAWKKEISKA